MNSLVNRIISVACALVLAVGLVPAPAFGAVTAATVEAATVEAADATEPTPDYVITDEASFKAFRDAVNAGLTTASTTARLDADISLTLSSSDLPVGTVDTASGSAEQMPSARHAFLGTFDGGFHSVTLNIGAMYSQGAKTQPAAALFGAVGESGVVKNLMVRGSVASAGSSSSSAINGAAASAVGVLFGGAVENVANYASIAGGNCSTDSCNSAGGIVGFGWGTVRNCANHAPVSKEGGWAAGIVGRCATGKATTIVNCYNTGAISYSGYAISSYYFRHAGIACSYAQKSYTSAIDMTKCYNAGNVWCSLSGGTDQSIATDYALVDKTTGTVSGCFWANDQGSDTPGAGITDAMATGMEAEAMRDAQFAATLGSPYAESTLKTLTPMLSWEGDVWDGRYAITVAETDGGTVTCSVDGPVTRAAEGDEVTVAATPNGGFDFAGLTVKDSSGKSVALTAGSRTGEFSFTMPADSVTVTPAFAAADAAALSFGIAMHDSNVTTFTRDQHLSNKQDFMIELTDVKKGGFTLGYGNKQDIANFTLQWYVKDGGSSEFTAIDGASGNVQWNATTNTVTTSGVDLPYRISADLKTVGTRQYKCFGRWVLDGYKTAEAESPVITLNVVSAGSTEALETVASADDFNTLAASLRAGVSYAGKTVTLASDVTIDAAQWTPLGLAADGTPYDAFDGTFDGGGHTVKIEGARNFGAPWNTCFGLFGYVSGATIRNLTVAGAIESDAGKVAAVVARVNSSGDDTLVSNVRNLASVTSTAVPVSPGTNGSDYTVGGIAGAGRVALSCCANKGAVSASSPFVATGGVAGAIEYGSSVASCYNLGAVTNAGAWDTSVTSAYQLWVAGIANSGVAGAATVSGCYNAGAVSASGSGDVTPGEVAAIVGGSVSALAAPTVSGSYYLEGSAPRGLGSIAAGRKGTAAPVAKDAASLKRLYATLGANWQNGDLKAADASAYPVLFWEEAHELAKFTVTFVTGFESDADAPLVVEAQTVQDGYPVAAEPTPARTGYVLRGWFLDGATTRVAFPFTPESSVSLYAKWTPDTSALASAISAARAEQRKKGSSYLVGESAEDVAMGWPFVTDAQATALETAIATATAARDDAETIGTSKTPDNVKAAADALQEAVSAFQAVYQSGKQVGTKIVSLSDPGANVEISLSGQTYTGEALEPLPVVKVNGATLAYRTDYTLKWTDNIEPGTASVTVTGMHAYKDSATATFGIAPAPMSGVDVVIADAPYAEGGAQPQVTATFDDGKVALSEGVDYTLSVSGADRVGTASATLTAIEGAGKRFEGAKTVEFNVVKAANAVSAARAGDCSVAYSPAAGTVQWVARDKAFSVTGASGALTFSKHSGDYRLGVDPATGAVRVAGGTDAGTYSLGVLVRAAGDANHEAGEAVVQLSVRVAPLSLANATVALSKASFTYNGAVQQPGVASVRVGNVTVPASGFTASAPRSVDAGSYSVSVTGRGNYTGTARMRPVYSIAKAANPLVVKAKSVKVKRSKKKKTVIAAAKALTVSGTQGALSYSRAGKSKLTVSRAGKITVPKGLKKGTYKVTVKVSAAGGGNYLRATKTATVKVKVR